MSSRATDGRGDPYDRGKKPDQALRQTSSPYATSPSKPTRVPSSASSAQTAPVKPLRCGSSPVSCRRQSEPYWSTACDIFTQSLEARRRIGYLPETPPLYSDMRVEAYLRFVAKLRGVARSEVDDAVERVLKVCGLADMAHRICGQLSKGYRQRVGLAQAIIHNPPVLVLDEPTIGLDPRQIHEIRGLIHGLADGPAHDRALDPHPARGFADLRPRRDHQRRARGAGGEPGQPAGRQVARRRIPGGHLEGAGHEVAAAAKRRWRRLERGTA